MFAQSNSCIDINNRIIYSYPLNGGLFCNPLSSSTNILLGNYQDINDNGIVISKSHLDNIVWVKKYRTFERNIGFVNAVQLPDNSIVTNSANHAGIELYIARFGSSGDLLWAKKYKPSILNSFIYYGNQTNNSIVYSNGYLFISTIFSTSSDEFYNIIAKLDLDGNPVWTKTFKQNHPVITTLSDPPMLNGDTITFVTNTKYKGTSRGGIDSLAFVITKLDVNTGSLICATKIKTTPDDFIKGAFVINAKIFKDNSISLTGLMGAEYYNGIFQYNNMPFVLNLDVGLNLVAAKYFAYPIPTAISSSLPHCSMSINNYKQTGLLVQDQPNGLAYTLIVDSNLNINRTRVFYPQDIFFTNSERTFDLDDQATAIYGFSRFNTNLQRTELEYFRINNLTPSNTIACFGRDTSVFTSHNFSTLKDNFVWDIQLTDMLIQTPINLIEEPITITKDMVCTQSSICDTIKIKGVAVHCLANPNASFRVYKNALCRRKVNWQLDTTAIKIISQLKDSIINVKFLKPFHGYIKASIEGCTLKDSFYIDVQPFTPIVSLGKDTTLCPGNSIILNAGTGFKSYKWQDNSIANTFTVSNPGVYSVQTIDSCNNIYNDTIIVKPMDLKLNLSYPNYICANDTAIINLDNNFQNYLWVPTDAGIKQNNLLKLFPKSSTLFTINAELLNGCSLSDTLLIKVEVCPQYVYFPNAFTPNNDGLNDIFKPIVSGHISEYKFSVFDRFGQQIFSSQKINEGWNGTLKGKPQNTGTFIWTCTYKIRNEKKVAKKGTIVLLR